MFKPKKIDADATLMLASDMVEWEDASKYPQLVATYNDLLEIGWRFYMVDQQRGQCYYGSKVITIPTWVLSRPAGKYIQYIAHEMAHAVLAGQQLQDAHGPEFMAAMRSICPAEYQHFELEYKMQQALAAGVTPHDF